MRFSRNLKCMLLLGLHGKSLTHKWRGDFKNWIEWDETGQTKNFFEFLHFSDIVICHKCYTKWTQIIGLALFHSLISFAFYKLEEWFQFSLYPVYSCANNYYATLYSAYNFKWLISRSCGMDVKELCQKVGQRRALVWQSEYSFYSRLKTRVIYEWKSIWISILKLQNATCISWRLSKHTLQHAIYVSIE